MLTIRSRSFLEIFFLTAFTAGPFFGFFTWLFTLFESFIFSPTYSLPPTTLPLVLWGGLGRGAFFGIFMGAFIGWLMRGVREPITFAGNNRVAQEAIKQVILAEGWQVEADGALLIAIPKMFRFQLIRWEAALGMMPTGIVIEGPAYYVKDVKRMVTAVCITMSVLAQP